MSDAKAILEQAAETLATAKAGLQMVASQDPAIRRMGLRNLVVFGRAVTNILQNLRSVTPDFDAWYSPWVEHMKADEVMAHLYKVRSEILKQGKMNTGVSIHIEHLDMGKLMSTVPKPPGATSFFIGDQLGGSGWTVRLPNGEEQKFYVALPNVPGVQITVNLHLADAPPALRDVPVQRLGQHYLTKLSEIVVDAKKRFGS